MDGAPTGASQTSPTVQQLRVIGSFGACRLVVACSVICAACSSDGPLSRIIWRHGHPSTPPRVSCSSVTSEPKAPSFSGFVTAHPNPSTRRRSSEHCFCAGQGAVNRRSGHISHNERTTGPCGRDHGSDRCTQPRNRAGSTKCSARYATGQPELLPAIGVAVTARGPKSASARPGPCTRPCSADALTRREYHPARPAPASRHPTVVDVNLPDYHPHGHSPPGCFVAAGRAGATRTGSPRRPGRPPPPHYRPTGPAGPPATPAQRHPGCC
jgi:hypothetical protein